MKRLILLSLNALLLTSVRAQVPKQVVVEHFTNTWCSTCASRNPGFFTNLSAFPQVIHLSYHPSSPYPQCELNQENKSGNDGRTQFYNVYGSTPRLVIQGTPIPAQSDYTDPALFNNELGDSSDFSVRVSIGFPSSDKAVTQVVIKRVASSGQSGALLFQGIFEDTVFRTNQNGEKNPVHVYRNGAPNGQNIQLPQNPGDSVVITEEHTLSQGWNTERLYGVALLYDEGTNYLQAGSSQGMPLLSLSSRKLSENAVGLYPLPCRDQLFNTLNEDAWFRITDLSGREIQSGFWKVGTALDLSTGSGTYLLQLKTTEGIRRRFFQVLP